MSASRSPVPPMTSPGPSEEDKRQLAKFLACADPGEWDGFEQTEDLKQVIAIKYSCQSYNYYRGIFNASKLSTLVAGPALSIIIVMNE